MKKTVKKKTGAGYGPAQGALRAQRANQKRLKQVSRQMKKTRGQK